MYIPRRYEEKDRETVFSFIRENSFGILVSVKDGRATGTHIPLLLEKDGEGKDLLIGHISRGNDQKQALVDGAEMLVIFPGPHAYVSPRWYTEMKVPTWNYISVHVYGRLRLIEGDELKDMMTRMVDHYEQGMPRPVRISEIPEKSLHDDLRGIIGFAIEIGEIQAAYKLSQNRDPQSYHNVVEELKKGDAEAQAVAEEMARRANSLE